jgi:hypothetical protein
MQNIVVSLRAPYRIIYENPPCCLGATGSTYLLHYRCLLYKSGNTAGLLIAGIFLAGDKGDDLKLFLPPKRAALRRSIRHLTLERVRSLFTLDDIISRSFSHWVGFWHRPKLTTSISEGTSPSRQGARIETSVPRNLSSTAAALQNYSGKNADYFRVFRPEASYRRRGIIRSGPGWPHNGWARLGAG